MGRSLGRATKQEYLENVEVQQVQQQSVRREGLEKLQSMGFPDLEIRQSLIELVCFAVKSYPNDLTTSPLVFLNVPFPLSDPSGSNTGQKGFVGPSIAKVFQNTRQQVRVCHC